ncbi:TPA: rod shape-determining protein MreD [Legionella pneumophila]|uniref:rod shape-determining protein MreD n=1 Tax=Legionella pneumophila TaxID=446 RepID=UPI0007869A34|nr:rod shape-determining protein MreD [Legionella pneumophila]MDW9167990.1 rod shape-determining protein MreD [Legionella pneumophila subsp. fraseri]MDX1846681.1 rod shape-determining protein MreD [Legionella pneumophila subsp. fraseri]HAT1659089.1 rod shape-determining protein MreD [Legionella pneumophila]HAT1772619.1 rod shape-determining protein MreD [Legionella pneumophila]HAT1882379.1 rod shape-determining protein MreD [Legionella pneumophila]
MSALHIRLGLGFVAALALSILPMPELISIFRPPWVLLLVLYIEYYLPGKFKLTALLIAGLLLDVLLSTVIGEHSFALLLVTWIASTKSRRVQFFSLIQQICLVGFFCFLYQSIILFIDALLGFNYNLVMPVTSAILGMIIWPWIRVLGDSSLLIRSVYR